MSARDSFSCCGTHITVTHLRRKSRRSWCGVVHRTMVWYIGRWCDTSNITSWEPLKKSDWLLSSSNIWTHCTIQYTESLSNPIFQLEFVELKIWRNPQRLHLYNKVLQENCSRIWMITSVKHSNYKSWLFWLLNMGIDDTIHLYPTEPPLQTHHTRIDSQFTFWLPSIYNPNLFSSVR